MKRNLKAVTTLGMAMAFIGAAIAAETKPAKPIVVSDKVTIKATVEAVDLTNRTLTLKSSKGEVMTFVVDEAVTRFDQVKVGDTITAKYYESVALELKKPGEAVPEESLAGVAGKIPGAKPGGMAGTQATMTVTVQAIDMETPAITVKTTDGKIINRRVAKKHNLKNVQVGDTIVITKTEALMIEVEGPK